MIGITKSTWDSTVGGNNGLIFNATRDMGGGITYARSSVMEVRNTFPIELGVHVNRNVPQETANLGQRFDYTILPCASTSCHTESTGLT